MFDWGLIEACIASCCALVNCSYSSGRSFLILVSSRHLEILYVSDRSVLFLLQYHTVLLICYFTNFIDS